MIHCYVEHPCHQRELLLGIKGGNWPFLARESNPSEGIPRGDSNPASTTCTVSQCSYLSLFSLETSSDWYAFLMLYKPIEKSTGTVKKNGQNGNRTRAYIWGAAHGCYPPSHSSRLIFRKKIVVLKYCAFVGHI